jgi:hypothetical protein
MAINGRCVMKRLSGVLVVSLASVWLACGTDDGGGSTCEKGVSRYEGICGSLGVNKSGALSDCEKMYDSLDASTKKAMDKAVSSGSCEELMAFAKQSGAPGCSCPVSTGVGESTGASFMCDALAKCGLDTGSCKTYATALVVSQDCKSKFLAASCDEHKQAQPSYMAACFPPCSGSDAKCSGNNLTACSNGMQMTMSCTETCKANGKTYVGACGSEYQGQKSSTGGDVCWCK